jgi:cation transport regulator ChaB
MQIAYNCDLPADIKKGLTFDEQSIFRKNYNCAAACGKSETQASLAGWIAVETRRGISALQKAEAEGAVIEDPQFRFVAAISKVDEEKQMVYGFASVIEKDGETVVDLQDDIISEDELIKAAHEFMRNSQEGHVLHTGFVGGDIPESLVLTKGLQDALNIDIGKVGWLIGYHVQDPTVWADVKSGRLREFSIGGSAMRIPMED